jgi:2-methylcitrate dehydratase PrpD
VIDACLDLRAVQRIDPAQIAKVETIINPLAEQLCGRKAPRDSLQGKLSLYHSAAVALLDGEAGVRQYTDARVLDSHVIALREKVAVSTDPTIGTDQARVRISLANGTGHEMFVEHARGSLERPMTDAELEAKFRSLAALELAPREIEKLLQQCWSLAELPNAAVLARGSVRKPGSVPGLGSQEIVVPG